MHYQGGISTELYKQSFSHEISGAKLGEGKSGMLFFHTFDQKFVIKTLKRGELNYLYNTK